MKIIIILIGIGLSYVFNGEVKYFLDEADGTLRISKTATSEAFEETYIREAEKY